jgi:hypothetical protein
MGLDRPSGAPAARFFRVVTDNRSVTRKRTFVGSVVLVGVIALAHAVVTWPVAATGALFGGGALVAFLAEAIVIRLGWLHHDIGPKVVGVPLYILSGWTGVIYVAFRIALTVTSGWPAGALAAGLATGYDLLTDHRGVADGHWRYTDDLPGPRFRGVPWWNFAGWFVISGLTAGIALPFL